MRWILDLYNSLKQQSVGRHVAQLGHVAIIPKCCLLIEKAANTTFLVFGLILLGLEPTIYLTQGEHTNHYMTDVVHYILYYLQICILKCYDNKTTSFVTSTIM